MQCITSRKERCRQDTSKILCVINHCVCKTPNVDDVDVCMTRNGLVTFYDGRPNFLMCSFTIIQPAICFGTLEEHVYYIVGLHYIRSNNE